MTWCSHRKGVNEGLSAAAALPAAIKADVLPLLLLSPPFTPPPAFPFCASGTGRGETGRRCRGGGRVAGWEGVMCVRARCLAYLVGETRDRLRHPSCYHRSVRLIRMCLPRSVPLT